MAIRIVTDSTCDLPQMLVERNQITVIPLFINFGDKTYRDGVDLSRDEFYRRLPGQHPLPTTAAPGPEILKQVYEELASHGATEILSIHISEKLSATVNIARQAAAETTRLPVTVYDSQQLSMGTGFLVLTAVEAAAKGKTVPEIKTILDEQVSRTHVFAVLDTLEFLRRSGRMNAAISRLGELLQIKPIMKMFSGNPTAERVRTQKRASRRLLELFQAAAPLEKVALLHSQASARAHQLLEQVNYLLPEAELLIEEITPTLGAHIGPGVVGFACVSKNKQVGAA